MWSHLQSFFPKISSILKKKNAKDGQKYWNNGIEMFSTLVNSMVISPLKRTVAEIKISAVRRKFCQISQGVILFNWILLKLSFNISWFLCTATPDPHSRVQGYALTDNVLFSLLTKYFGVQVHSFPGLSKYVRPRWGFSLFSICVQYRGGVTKQRQIHSYYKLIRHAFLKLKLRNIISYLAFVWLIRLD